MKTFLISTGVVVAFASHAGAEPLPRWSEYRAEPHVQKQASAGPKKTKPGLERPMHVVRLPEADAAKLSTLSTGERGHRVGVPRAVDALAQEGMAARLPWQRTDDGRLLSQIAIVSPGAAALRLGLLAKALPPTAVFRFHGGDGREAFEVRGEEILESLADNLEAGNHGAAAHTYWSPIVDSSTAMMEIELPVGARPQDLQVTVPIVSHLMSSARTGFAKSEPGCSIDAKCHESSWSGEMNAVARMLFTRDGATYACTGTLLADQARSGTPYFKTAAHCIPTQADASTVATYWFYRSSSCGADSPGRFEVRHGGAVLLHVDTSTDSALVRLNAAPPAGAVYVGWIASPAVTLGSAVTGIHHSGSGSQKISFGTLASFGTCVGGSLCRMGAAPDANFYHVSWRSGATLAGASGSALFIDKGRYLIGQLSSGFHSCTPGSGGDFYGRFDTAYHGGLHKWLGAAATPAEPIAPQPHSSGPRLRLTTTLFSLGSRSQLKSR